MWRDEGTWIALGVSALFLVAAGIMHRLFVRILKDGATEPVKKEKHE
jgi:hypothetical protein